MNENVRYFFGILAIIEIFGDYLGLIRQNELSMIEGSRNRLYVVDYGQNLMRMVQMMTSGYANSPQYWGKFANMMNAFGRVKGVFI